MVLLCSVAARGHVSFAQAQPNAVLSDGVAQLLLKIEAAVGAGSGSDFLALSTLNPDDPNVRAFLDRWLVSRTTRATVRERDRLPLDGGGVRLMAEALIEAGSEGRLATWTLEIAPAPDGTWRLTKATTSGMVDGLFHLELDPTRAFRAHDLVVLAEDFELRLPAGDVFVALAGGRVSAAVLMGRGTMTFRPTPDTERRQVELYCGREALTTQFDWAFLRLSPGEAETRLPAEHLTPSNVDKGMLSRASEVFAEQLPKSFGVELGDLTASRGRSRRRLETSSRKSTPGSTARSPTPTPTTIRKTSPSSTAAPSQHCGLHVGRAAGLAEPGLQRRRLHRVPRTGLPGGVVFVVDLALRGPARSRHVNRNVAMVLAVEDGDVFLIVVGVGRASVP